VSPREPDGRNSDDDASREIDRITVFVAVVFIGLLVGAYYLVALPAARRQKDVRSVWQWLAAEAAVPSIAAAA